MGLRVSLDAEDNWDDYPELLTTRLVWSPSPPNSQYLVYHAVVDGKPWNIRMNDFPDEPLYTLLVDRAAVIHFNDWPAFWGVRPSP